LLAKNFGLPPSTFENFPKNEVYFAKGKIPPAVPSVPLQGWKPPPLTHKYSLLSQKPYETFNGGIEWRVDGSQFPISTTMTGVVLEMEPGALRELHWHPNAAEWQYVLSGDFCVSLFGSNGRWRQENLSKGDVGYIPQGFGHSIENIGRDKGRILIVFNNGHYQTINLSQWIAGNPVDILATNFSQDPAVFEKFPRKDVFMTK
jgi:oxalate decarboxylase